MKTPIRTILIFAAFFSGFASGDLYAQWKVLAQGLISPYTGGNANPEYGAIHFKDGILWAGWKDTNTVPATVHRSSVWFSNDTGKTWQQSTLIVIGAIITDINFYDKLNGLVSTLNNGLFLTRNGGISWQRILLVQQCMNVVFDGSPNIIHALTAGDVPSPTGLLHTSINGGASWTSSSPGGEFSQCFTIAKDRTIYVLNSSDNTAGLPGFVSFSTDLGSTWQQQSAEIDGDSYSICADSCDAGRLYVANEDYTATVNNLADLYYTSSAGNSWTRAVGFALPYLTGAMTCSKNAIYASSLIKGIYRSTDKGVTWKNIGGPKRPNPKDHSMSFDSRNIACVDDNIIFLLDDEGSIWNTINSGGDSLLKLPSNSILSFTPDTLFNADSIFTCDSVINKKIYITSLGCRSPKIISSSLNGANASSFEILSVPSTLGGNDSVMVTFRPQNSGKLSAELTITLDDGRILTIPVSGYGIPSIPLTISTQDQTADTLGGTVVVPISVSGLQKPEDITIVVHYDSVLNYNGSFSPANARLDMPGQQWKGRSKISIPNAKTSGILANAFFDVFNDSLIRQLVWFDSIDVVTVVPICRYATASVAAAFSNINALSGCGMQMLSRFIHYNEVPQFIIMPNPAGGDAFITSSANLGETNIQVIDMLGAERGASTLTLSKNSPAKIELPVPSGIYVLRINSVAGIYDLRIVVSK